MWQPLFANLAVVAIALMAWNVLGEHLARLQPLSWKLLFGAFMAAGALGSMAMAFEPVPGIFYDLRGPLLAVTGFFGGAPAAAITATAAVLYRISLGGAVATGLAQILITALLGIGGNLLCRLRPASMLGLTGLAALVAVQSMPLLLFLPAASRAVLLPHIWALAALSFVSTLMLGAVLLLEQRRVALARTNQLYRFMVDALSDCLNIKDEKGRFLVANPATARMMRAASPEALIGKTDFDFYPADIAAAFRAEEESIMQAGVHCTVAQQGMMGDGSAWWLSTLKTPISDSRGRISSLVTHNRDITEAKRLQEQLERTQSYLDQALENMSDGLVLFDAEGTLLLCNGRYRELFPRTAHLRISGTPLETILRAALELGEERLSEGATIQQHVDARLATVRQDGTHLINLLDGRVFSSRSKLLANGCTLCMTSDITERRNFEKNLEHQALHDPLTGLPNRLCFNREFERLLARARTGGTDLAVMLLDLDRFKEVNDTHGHAAGDALLVEVARRLRASVRPGDVVARLGGDEFALLLPGNPDIPVEVGIATRLMTSIAQPLSFGDVTLLPGGTLGYTLVSEDPSDADTLLRNADQALYAAKGRRRGSWKKWSPPRGLETLAG